MGFSVGTIGLYTDLYELAMAQGYFLSGKKDSRVSFDYFFRTNPFNSGFTVFAGLYDLLELLADFRFSDEDIRYLKNQGMNPDFIEYLKTFSFSGTIYGMNEGDIVFPNEPILRVDGNIIEAQLIESLLLNILNFETLIATKAYRVKVASGKGVFSDFGMRRAQGFGAIHASRAACIGGATSTSNVLAGKLFDIPVTGTMAHSWVQSFPTEYEAFRLFSEYFPDNTILLVDTYDTLSSGVPNAIKIAKEMEQIGHRLKGIRLDSGDLAYFSKKTRAKLNEAGLEYVKIIVSNQLNEFVINSLINEQHAPIDAFGVGTEMVTGKPDAALDGVYKLASIESEPKMKISENIEKVTLPGIKKVCRFFDVEGKFYRDGILLEEENSASVTTLYNPVYQDKFTNISGLTSEVLMAKVYSGNKILVEKKNPLEIHSYLQKRAELLPAEHKRFVSPHIYKVGISEELMKLRNGLLGKYRNKF
jgi:nicotinate phosphoribosyltransferase